MTERPLADRLEAMQRRLDDLLERATAEGGGGDLLRGALEQLQVLLQELQTAGEELHTIRGELEAARDELQSTNEELRTINEQLRQRTDEAICAGDLLSEILATRDAGVVGVDRHLVVVSWNQRAEEIWGLRAADAIGRPLLGLDMGLPPVALGEALRRIVGGGQGRQELALDGVSPRGEPVHYDVIVAPLPPLAAPRRGAVLLVMGRAG